MPKLSVIVAAFNEQETIEACVRRIFAVFPGDCEVLVVDGGSDATGKIVCEISEHLPGLRYIHNKDDRGKGHAIRTGVQGGRRRRDGAN